MFTYDEQGDLITLFRASSIPIRRHIKIRDIANPYGSKHEAYFEQRTDQLMLQKLAGKRMVTYLYQRQQGKCLICQKKITTKSGYNTHHLIPKYLGGKWRAENLVLLHPVCHIQVYQNQRVAAALAKQTGVKNT